MHISTYASIDWWMKGLPNDYDERQAGGGQECEKCLGFKWSKCCCNGDVSSKAEPNQWVKLTKQEKNKVF